MSEFELSKGRLIKVEGKTGAKEQFKAIKKVAPPSLSSNTDQLPNHYPAVHISPQDDKVRIIKGPHKGFKGTVSKVPVTETRKASKAALAEAKAIVIADEAKTKQEKAASALAEAKAIGDAQDIEAKKKNAADAEAAASTAKANATAAKETEQAQEKKKEIFVEVRVDRFVDYKEGQDWSKFCQALSHDGFIPIPPDGDRRDVWELVSNRCKGRTIKEESDASKQLEKEEPLRTIKEESDASKQLEKEEPLRIELPER